MSEAKIVAALSNPGSFCKPPTCVRPVTSRVMPTVTPRMMNRVARVTMNDGNPVRTTTRPLMNPITRAKTSAVTMPHQKLSPSCVGINAAMMLAGADDRADREIELPGDHQQRDGDRQDAELGRDFEVGGDAPRRDESAIAGEDGEDDPDDDRAEERADLRPQQEPPPARNLPAARRFADRLRIGGDCLARHRCLFPADALHVMRCRLQMELRVGLRPDPHPRSRELGAENAARPYRVPASDSSITRSAFSAVTKPGPVMITGLATVFRFSA